MKLNHYRLKAVNNFNLQRRARPSGGARTKVKAISCLAY
jgi:hypothetical protein